MKRYFITLKNLPQRTICADKERYFFSSLFFFALLLNFINTTKVASRHKDTCKWVVRFFFTLLWYYKESIVLVASFPLRIYTGDQSHSTRHNHFPFSSSTTIRRGESRRRPRRDRVTCGWRRLSVRKKWHCVSVFCYLFSKPSHRSILTFSCKLIYTFYLHNNYAIFGIAFDETMLLRWNSFCPSYKNLAFI